MKKHKKKNMKNTDKKLKLNSLFILGIIGCLFCLRSVSSAEAASNFVERNYYGAKLEPVTQVLHGAGQSNWNTGTIEYKNSLPQGYSPVIINDYCNAKGDQGYVDNLVARLSSWLSNFPDYTVLQIGLSMTGETQNIANGVYDNNLNYLFTELEKLSIPIYFRIGFEFNGGWNSYPGNTFKLAFQHITNILRNHSLGNNSATVWCFAPDGNSNYMDWYPGDSYVDWWGIDVFNVGHLTKGSTINFLADAHTHQKPIMIGESTPRYTGVLNGQQSWNDWFGPYFQWIHDNPGIKAYNHINWNWEQYPEFSGWGDARIGQNQFVLDLYKQEMTSPVYLHASTEQNFLSSLNTGVADNIPPVAPTLLSVIVN